MKIAQSKCRTLCVINVQACSVTPSPSAPSICCLEMKREMFQVSGSEPSTGTDLEVLKV